MIGTAQVCAVVVAYFPDSGFRERLARVQRQVGALIVVDNTPEPVAEESLRELGKRAPPILVISNRGNVGLATALNQGLGRALAMGYRWILTLDQDTTCGDDMVATLVRVAATCGMEPAVIGSNYSFGIRRRLFEAPPDGPGECLECHTVISSGSLIDAHFAKAIGGFRDEYFVDQIDHEFCLRVRSFGRRIVISRKPVMEHSVGDSQGAHSPLREYYIMRNAIALLRSYWRREPQWCAYHMATLARHLCHMAMWHPQRLAKVRAIRAGAADALAGRMGSCQRPWLNA